MAFNPIARSPRSRVTIREIRAGPTFSVLGGNNELREDNNEELREDGGLELRE